MSVVNALALGWEARTWEPRSSMATMSRAAAARKGTPYQAAVPPQIATMRFTFGDAVLAAAEDARAEVTRFDAELSAMFGGEGEFAPLATVLLRTESSSSLADREHHRRGPGAGPGRDRARPARLERGARRGERRGDAASRRRGGPVDAGIPPRDPRRAHARPAIGGSGSLPHRTGVDRRVGGLPARGTVRPAAPRAHSGRHRGPLRLPRAHRPALGRARRGRPRPVRDDPPVRRRQRQDRARPGARHAEARSGHHPHDGAGVGRAADRLPAPTSRR